MVGTNFLRSRLLKWGVVIGRGKWREKAAIAARTFFPQPSGGLFGLFSLEELGF